MNLCSLRPSVPRLVEDRDYNEPLKIVDVWIGHMIYYFRVNHGKDDVSDEGKKNFAAHNDEKLKN